MTFSTAVPAATDSPAIFPAQNQTNMTRLQTIVQADHQFNLTAAANDGYHNIIHLTSQSTPVAIGSTGQAYAKLSNGRLHLSYTDEAGTSYQITPTMPIRAAVNFTGTGAVGACPLNSAYNVTSVNKTATGAYTITFTTAMPDNKYIVQLCGMRGATTSTCNGSIKGDTVLGNSMTTTTLKIQFNGGTASLDDVLVGCVTIFSVS